MDSTAWNYFTKDDTGLKAICNICKASIGCKGSSTSGLLRHLKNIHRELVPQKRKADEDMADQPSQRKKVKQQTLDRAFMSAKRSSLAEILARLAAEDGISIRAITRSKFIRNSISAQGYTPPKCEKTAMKLIIEYHHAIVAEVKKEIADKVSNGERFSITLDEWTSTRNRRYMNVNVHDKAGMMNKTGLFCVFFLFDCFLFRFSYKHNSHDLPSDLLFSLLRNSFVQFMYETVNLEKLMSGEGLEPQTVAI